MYIFKHYSKYLTFYAIYSAPLIKCNNYFAVQEAHRQRVVVAIQLEVIKNLYAAEYIAVNKDSIVACITRKDSKDCLSFKNLDIICKHSVAGYEPSLKEELKTDSKLLKELVNTVQLHTSFVKSVLLDICLEV